MLPLNDVGDSVVCYQHVYGKNYYRTPYSEQQGVYRYNLKVIQGLSPEEPGDPCSLKA